MPRLDSPFSLHKPWPATPEEIARARGDHLRAQRDRQTLELETIPPPNSLARLLTARRLEFDVTRPEKNEQQAYHLLYAARLSDPPDESAIRTLREAIWSYSPKQRQPQAERAAQLVAGLLQGVQTRQRELARTDEREARELDEEVERLEHLKNTLKGALRGELIESDARTIEDWYASTLRRAQNESLPVRLQKQAGRELRDLRLIRDEVYYRRLFPNWGLINPKS